MTADGLGWRTRVQFAVDQDGTAGLRAHRSHEVIDIGDCLIAHAGMRDLGIPRRHWDGATAVETAVGDSGREAVVVPSDRGPPPRRERRAPARWGDASPGERGRDPVRPGEAEGVQTVAAESILVRSGRRLTPVRGRAYLTQHAAGREWRVSAGAFWQVHPAAADTLTAAVLAALEPKPGDSALDLYCGAGLFAGSLAPAWARREPSSALNPRRPPSGTRGTTCANFPGRGCAAAKPSEVLTCAAGCRRPGWRSLDPPRAGLDRRVIDYLSTAESGTERFCYVSCDPATLARDIGLLLADGWRLDALRAFDAFPMTHHVECVATLARSCPA